MKQFWLFIFFTLIIACLVMGGVLLGQSFMDHQNVNVHHHATGDIHALFHSDLDLNVQQEKELMVLEKDFRRQKSLFEEKMKIANMQLAEAIKKDGYSSSQVQDAIDKIHTAMGELQKLTLQHLADMQTLLSDEQNKKLEEIVVEQLYRNAGQ